MPTPTFILPSRITGTKYVISLGIPRTPSGARRGPWPVIFFLDGDDQFRTALAAYRALRKMRRIRPLLLVGVGYGASYSKPGNGRGRDYTPTPHADEPTSGGGDGFFAFLTRELWPEIARRHRVRDDRRGIAGHSLGALFALHALFHRPKFFTHYLVSAPSIWWDNRSMLRLAAERRKRSAVLDATLFLSVGLGDSPSMREDLGALEEQLTQKPFRGLRITSERFPGRDHYTSISDGFRAGLIALFAGDEKG